MAIKSPYPNIGELNRPIHIQSFTNSKSSKSGAETKAWVTLYTLNAKVEYAGGSEPDQGGSILTKQNAKFTARWASGIDESMRIVFNNQNYDIKVIEVIGRNRFLKFNTQLTK